MQKHASLCILSYKRPDALKKCLTSLVATTSYPFSLIVNSDGGDSENEGHLYFLFAERIISSLIFNNGKNRGVGRSLQNAVALAEGEYIFKLDADLTFEPRWLETCIGILDNNPDVGSVGLFDYRHYDPNDTRFEIVEERSDCFIVNDFVSSGFGFRNKDIGEGLRKVVTLSEGGNFTLPDDGLHQAFGKMAIPKQDVAKNHGFGVTKSVYVSGTEDHPYKTPTYDEPLIHRK